MSARPGGLPERVPLFPLPDHVFLPGVPVPYRIFEPRYRALVRDLLKSPPPERWLAIPRLSPGWRVEEYDGAPAFDPIATIGQVIHCAPLPGGEFHIVVQGITRVSLEELPSAAAYRIARPEPYEDEPEDAATRATRATVADAVAQSTRMLAQMIGPPADELARLAGERGDEERWIFNLGSVLLSDADERHRFLASRSAAQRLDLLLGQLATLLHLVGTKGPGKDRLPEG
ncbi:MAG: LON peptidase substrate-binding domain-containing protein [Acidobacteria bacterium]|nr:LON peptidase substrate-binding domain-containing protein [Acidobacteriota bacterium]